MLHRCMFRLAGAGLLAGLAASVAGAAEFRIGVVNIDEILARCRKAEDMRKVEEEKLESRREKLAGRSLDLNRRIAEIQTRPAQGDDPERRKLTRELEVKKFLLELDVRDFRRDKRLAGDSIRRLITDEVLAVCRRIGKAEGYDLILKRSSPGVDRDDDREQIAAFELNPVLYAAETMDITQHVLDVLEDAYRRGMKLAPGRRGTSGRSRPGRDRRRSGPSGAEPAGAAERVGE